MLVRILKVRVNPAFRSAIEQIEDEVSRLYVPEAGCRFVQFFGDPVTGWYGNVAIFDSRASADALAARPEMAAIAERLKPLVIEPPIIEMYPVYQPRSSN
jgi:hypothetical protein